MYRANNSYLYINEIIITLASQLRFDNKLQLILQRNTDYPSVFYSLASILVFLNQP